MGTKITKCDYEKKRVETASGEIIEYDALVIATGVSAHPGSFIEGFDGKMCNGLRSHEDALEVVKAMDAKLHHPVVVAVMQLHLLLLKHLKPPKRKLMH